MPSDPGTEAIQQAGTPRKAGFVDLDAGPKDRFRQPAPVETECDGGMPANRPVRESAESARWDSTTAPQGTRRGPARPPASRLFVRGKRIGQGDAAADARVQDAPRSIDGDEGGMIALAAVTDSAGGRLRAARQQIAAGRSKALPPAGKIDVDNGLGLFQAFEMAGVSSPSASSTGEAVGKLDAAPTPNEAAPTVPAEDIPAGEKPAAAGRDSAGGKGRLASAASTIVVASLAGAAVAVHRRDETPGDRRNTTQD